ncbi:hypothetical protein [Halomonas denitrificans]|uniref:hypothetical protein n=1 Tax=Halomonas denitrificans TaxID=370769 RepID=UPI000D3D799A|nr:hypothetical protein [Halomonas denitrificans]
MSEITIMPAPMRRWVTMCPCGASEIRAEEGPRWRMFTLRKLEEKRYHIHCHACGHANEQWIG